LLPPGYILFLGLVLLFAPAPIWFGGNVRFRTIEYLNLARRNGSWLRVWRKVLSTRIHWIELVRAYAGTFCLAQSLETIRASGAYRSFSAPWIVGGIAVGAATLGLIIMMATFRKTEATLAPISFVAGAVLAAMSPMVALLALILALSTMATLQSLAAFFVVLALGLAGLGLGFGSPPLLAACGAAFAATPVLVAFFTRRELVITIRRSRSEQEAGPRR